MAAVGGTSREIGFFLDWLNEQGICLAQHRDWALCEWTPWPLGRWAGDVRCLDGNLVDEEGESIDGECPACRGTGRVKLEHAVLDTYHESGGYEALLARYYEIDLDKVEQERRAMIEALQAANG